MKPLRRHILLHLVWISLSAVGFAQMLPVKSGRLWGIIDPSGRIIAPAKFDAIARIMDRQAVIVLNGKYGLLDSSGAMLIEPTFTYLNCISQDINGNADVVCRL